MRRSTLALLAATVAVGLSLAGCGDGSGTEETPETGATPSETSAPEGSGATETTDLFSASGEFGEKPSLEFPSDDPPEGLLAETLVEGDGPVVEPGSAVTANYLGQVWGGDEPFDNSYDRGATSTFSLNSVVAGWTQGIPGHTVGSRILLSIPADLGYGPQGGDAGAGIGAEDTIVFVVDIVEAYGPDVVAQADAAPADVELPVDVTGALGEPITAVTLHEGATLAADEPRATVIATGTGPAVEQGETLIVQFAGTSEDGAQQVSSWDTTRDGYGPVAPMVGAGTVFDLLAGESVGSRVLLEIPASEQQPSALAIVVDLVAVPPQQ